MTGPLSPDPPGSWPCAHGTRSNFSLTVPASSTRFTTHDTWYFFFSPRPIYRALIRPRPLLSALVDNPPIAHWETPSPWSSLLSISQDIQLAQEAGLVALTCLLYWELQSTCICPGVRRRKKSTKSTFFSWNRKRKVCSLGHWRPDLTNRNQSQSMSMNPEILRSRSSQMTRS